MAFYTYEEMSYTGHNGENRKILIVVSEGSTEKNLYIEMKDCEGAMSSVNITDPRLINFLIDVLSKHKK